MAKELAKVETNLPAELTGTWGTEGVDKSDLMIPKLLLQQGLSAAVNDDKAAMGDIINSITSEKLGDVKNPVEVIPLSTFKTWVISHRAKGTPKFEFEDVVTMTAANANWEWEDTLPDGTGVRRDQTLNFYVLIPAEIEGGAAMPYVVSFRRTSYKAGKKLINHFTKMGMLKQPPAAKTVKLLAKKEQNDLGTYFVFDVEPGRVSNIKELTVAREWYDVVSKGQHRVDDRDLQTEETVASASVQRDASGQSQF